MPTNSQPTSRRIQAVQRQLRNARTGARPLTEAEAERIERLLGECAAEVSNLELQTGLAPVTDQLRAAGGNIVMLKAVLANARGGRNGH